MWRGHRNIPDCAILYLYRDAVVKSHLATKAHDSRTGNQRPVTVINAQSDEPNKLDEPKLDNETHESREWVETNIVSSLMRSETSISLQNQIADNVINTIQLQICCKNQSDKQTQTEKIQNTDENDWRNEVQILDDFNLNRAKILNVLSEF